MCEPNAGHFCHALKAACEVSALETTIHIDEFFQCAIFFKLSSITKIIIQLNKLFSDVDFFKTKHRLLNLRTRYSLPELTGIYSDPL